MERRGRNLLRVSGQRPERQGYGAEESGRGARKARGARENWAFRVVSTTPARRTRPGAAVFSGRPARAGSRRRAGRRRRHDHLGRPPAGGRGDCGSAACMRLDRRRRGARRRVNGSRERNRSEAGEWVVSPGRLRCPVARERLAGVVLFLPALQKVDTQARAPAGYERNPKRRAPCHDRSRVEPIEQLVVKTDRSSAGTRRGRE